MTCTFQGSVAPWRRIVGVEPVVAPSGECTEVIAHTTTALMRVHVAGTSERNPLRVQPAPLSAYSKSFFKCSQEQTIVCTSNGVAVIANASSRESDAHFVRFDPRTCRCARHVSARTALSKSSTLLVAAVTPDAKLLVGGTREGQVKVWSLTNGTLLHTFTRNHGDWVTCVKVSALSADGLPGQARARYTAMSLGVDGSAMVHFIGPSTFVTCVFPADEYDEIVTQDDDQETEKRDSQNHESTSEENDAVEFENRGNLACVDVSADGRFGLLGYANGSLVLWDLTTGALREVNEGKSRRMQQWGMWESPRSICFHPTRFEALVSFQSGWIHRIDLESEKRMLSIFNSAGSSSLAYCAWIGDSLRFVLSRNNSLWTGEARKDSEEVEDEGEEDA